MESREAPGLVKLTLLLLVGVLLSVMAVTALSELVLLIWLRVAGWSPAGWIVYGLMMLLLVPLLFWWEIRAQGRFLEQELPQWSMDTNEFGLARSGSYGEWELNRSGAAWCL